MNMPSRLAVALGILVLAGSLGGCDLDEQGMTSCSLTANITFNDREYIAVGSLPGVTGTEARTGKHLGTGEIGTCPGEPERQVQVYKLVGVPVERAVFSKQEHGLMRSLKPGEAIE